MLVATRGRAGRRPRTVPLLGVRVVSAADADPLEVACGRVEQAAGNRESSCAGVTAIRSTPSCAACPWGAGCRDGTDHDSPAAADAGTRSRRHHPPSGRRCIPSWPSRVWVSTACSSAGTCSDRRFRYDPFALYRSGLLTNPNMVVVGQIGRGKSAFVKTYLWRQAVFGRRAWVVDPKGEYGALAAAWGVKPVALRPGGVGPPQPARRRRSGATGRRRRRPCAGAELLASLAAASLGRALLPTERSALELAVGGGGVRWRRRPTSPGAVPRCRWWSTPCFVRRALGRDVGTDVGRTGRRRPARGSGVAPPGGGRPARHVRRAHHGGHRPRRAARRARPVGGVPLGCPGGPHDVRHGVAAGRAGRTHPPDQSRVVVVVDEAWAILANLARGSLAPVVVEAVAGPGRLQRGRAPPPVGPRHDGGGGVGAGRSGPGAAGGLRDARRLRPAPR